MEKIYFKDKNECKLVAANKETVQFLLSYSKSLNIVDYKGMKFENNSN